MVLQDSWLFTGTIRENLMYGNPTATEEEMIAAAKKAHAVSYTHLDVYKRQRYDDCLLIPIYNG